MMDIPEHSFDLQVCPTVPLSMSVYVNNAGTVDLSGMQPKSGHKWVLIALGEDGPYAIEGEETDVVLFVNIPLGDPNHKKLAAVHLTSETEIITDGLDTPVEILDLRQVGTYSNMLPEALRETGRGD